MLMNRGAERGSLRHRAVVSVPEGALGQQCTGRQGERGVGPRPEGKGHVRLGRKPRSLALRTRDATKRGQAPCHPFGPS